MTIKIHYKNLAPLESQTELFINKMSMPGSIRIIINGKELPGIICPDYFHEWIEMLTDTMKAFKEGKDTYIFEGVDQGTPAYKFEKKGDKIYISIIDSEVFGGEADPEWQNIAFENDEFEDEYNTLKTNVLKEVIDKKPDYIKRWRKKFM